MIVAGEPQPRLGRLDDGPHQQAEHRGGEDQAAAVQRRGSGVAGLGDEERGEAGGHEGERREREEHTAPREVGEQQAADDRAGRDADPDDSAPATERGGPLPTVGERVGDHRQRRGEDQRREDAHDDPSGDERAVSGDEAADDARSGEADEAHEERRTASVPVGEAPRGQDEGGEGEVVAVDDPLEIPRAGAELPGDARQRHVDDGGVEVDGEDRGVDRDQDSGLALHGTSANNGCGQCQHRPVDHSGCGQCQHVGRITDVKAYHHGNLRAELLRTAVELAREEGPSGVVLREVARRAGRLAQRRIPALRRPEELLVATAEAGQDELVPRHGQPGRAGPGRRPRRSVGATAARDRQGVRPLRRARARTLRHRLRRHGGAPQRPARPLRAAQRGPRRDGRVRHAVTATGARAPRWPAGRPCTGSPCCTSTDR